MSAFTARDPEAADLAAADLPAPARLDDDGGPYPGDLRRSRPGRPRPDSDGGRMAAIPAAPDPRRQLTPALMGVG